MHRAAVGSQANQTSRMGGSFPGPDPGNQRKGSAGLHQVEAGQKCRSNCRPLRSLYLRLPLLLDHCWFRTGSSLLSGDHRRPPAHPSACGFFQALQQGHQHDFSYGHRPQSIRQHHECTQCSTLVNCAGKQREKRIDLEGRSKVRELVWILKKGLIACPQRHWYSLRGW